MFAESGVIYYIVYTCIGYFSFPYDKVIEVLCGKIDFINPKLTGDKSQSIGKPF